MNLLVSFHTEADQRKIFNEGLNGDYNISYLEDAANRTRSDKECRRHPGMESTVGVFTRGVSPLLPCSSDAAVLGGGDHLPDELFKMNFDVAGNVGAYAVPMAEHVLAMVLALAKDLKGGYVKLKAGNFDQFSPNRSISGANVAILGLGGIGKASARLFKAFGANISRSILADEPKRRSISSVQRAICSMYSARLTSSSFPWLSPMSPRI